MAEYSLQPVEVKKVSTRFREIRTKLPVPESLAVFRALQESEPRSMMGMPPVVWDRAEGFSIYDRWGNRWIDWSSGVLIANAGHGHPAVIQALREQIDQGLVATYVFVHEKRAALTKALQALSPDPAGYKVFLLTTGSEAIENCVKLSKTYALRTYGPQKNHIVSFHNAFHGRTMGAQLVGGIRSQKEWLGESDPTFIQVPFPDWYNEPHCSFDVFLNALKEQGVSPDRIAGVITESYQGGGPHFLPVEYALELESFCRQHDIVLTFDEVQAGFGRTGKMFCYEHYGVKPDLIACGKGVTSSLPLAAVIGRQDIMDLYPPGSMTSTHSASPLAVAAALANLAALREENLVENARRMGEILIPELRRIREKYPRRLGTVLGKGLVAGVLAVKDGAREPDAETALKINVSCYRKGVLMFAPVGKGGESIKIAPPLCINEDALRESIGVFEEAVDETLG